MNDRATQKMCEQWQDGVEAVEGGRPDPEEFYAWLAERDRQEREKGRDEVLAMLESDEAALAREYRGRLSNGADPEPQLIDTVSDLSWFQKVLDESRETLNALPPGSQPSWYREYMASRKSSHAGSES